MIGFSDFLVWSIYIVMVSVTVFVVNDTFKEPYMDEYFHIPQVRVWFEQGNYKHWDSKITTLPGLYLYTIPFLYAGAYLQSLDEMLLNFVEVVRGINSLFAVFIPIVCYLLALKRQHVERLPVSEVMPIEEQRRRDESRTQFKAMWTALEMSTFPIMFYFHFFYYTDSASVFFVLTSYLCALHDQRFFSAASSVFAVLMRQTNIIWLFFVWCVLLLQDDISSLETASSQTMAAASISVLKYGTRGRDHDKQTVRQLVVAENSHHNTIISLGGFVGRTLQRFTAIVKGDFCFLFGIILFGSFVHVNQGIVVGDRSNHTVQLHGAQLGYFAIFAFAMMGTTALRGALSWSTYKPLFTGKGGYAAVVSVITLGMFYLVHTQTIAHPFLLADNRHIPFYLWKNLLGKHVWLREMLVVAYVWAGFVLWSQLRRAKSLLWSLAFAVCSAASMVLSPLLEFRYFIIPFMLLRLEISSGPAESPTTKWRLVNVCFNVGVHATMLALLVFKPMTWPDGSIARIMW